MRGEVDVFGLVLSGPEAPVTFGRRIVFAGLAPAGTAAVTVRGPGTEQTVKPREDGSFALRFAVTAPGSYRAVSADLSSPAVRVQLKPILRTTLTGRTLRVSASPARPGAPVVIQRYDRERFAWRDQAHGTLDARSRATFRIPAGIPLVRAVVRGAKGWADAATPAISLVGGGAAGSAGSRATRAVTSAEQAASLPAERRCHVGLDLQLRQRPVVDTHVVDQTREVLAERAVSPIHSGLDDGLIEPDAAFEATAAPFTYRRSVVPS